MFYRKNVFAWEQVVRIVAGIAMIGFGLFSLPGNWVGYAIAILGLYNLATGIVGYCPACAVLGRKPISKP